MRFVWVAIEFSSADCALELPHVAVEFSSTDCAL